MKTETELLEMKWQKRLYQKGKNVKRRTHQSNAAKISNMIKADLRSHDTGGRNDDWKHYDQKETHKCIQITEHQIY